MSTSPDLDKPLGTPHRRRSVLIFLTTTTVIVGLALGLGLGLTIGRKHHKDSDNNDNTPTVPPTITSRPLPSPSAQPAWLPKPGTPWQILLLNPPQLASSAETPIPSPDVPVYDIDLFTTPASTIAALHNAGKRVLCYFSGGSYEPGRPDSGEFKEEDMGAGLEGWPGERWVRLGSEGIRKIMKGRVELAAQKGCDGVDVDNVDGYVSMIFPLCCLSYRLRCISLRVEIWTCPLPSL
jgi:hypothetical protein